MELACDILKQSKEIKIENKVNKKFKNLHLNSISNLHDFLNIIKQNTYTNTATSLLNQYFDDVDEDMSEGLLMAYCISLFSDQIFDSYKSRFEQKLILTANKVVLIVNNMLDNMEPSNEFYNIIDVYYSLYKVWKSQDSINILTKLFGEIQDEINIINIQTKRGININLTQSKDLVSQLFNQNPKYAIRILLHNYDIFRNAEELEEYFWQCVQKHYNQYQEAIFVILVSELKIRLIPILTNPSDRKKVYYCIDTEDIIHKISNSGLTNEMISNIVNIFGNKIKKINSNFIFETISVENIPVNLFKGFYHATLIK